MNPTLQHISMQIIVFLHFLFTGIFVCPPPMNKYINKNQCVIVLKGCSHKILIVLKLMQGSALIYTRIHTVYEPHILECHILNTPNHVFTVIQ